MKTSILCRISAVVGLALLLGGCASLRPEPIWICGNGLILLDEEPAVEAAAVPAPAGHDTTMVQAKPAEDEEVILLHNCWDAPEPRKRAEAAVMY